MDCGTSYIKQSVVAPTGTEQYYSRAPSPAFNVASAHDVSYPSALWRKISSILAEAVGKANRTPPRIIAIAGISPVLTLFDRQYPDHVVAMPYWRLPEIDEQAVGFERTQRRTRYLRLLAGAEFRHNRFLVCDLIGYLNFRLTGKLTINSITASELGFPDEFELFRTMPGISLASPAELVGATKVASQDLAVCAGSSDSFAAALSAGATDAGSRMIYLGTFGSLLEVVEDLLLAAKSNRIRRLPYQWRLSVPRFGTTIEHFACANFPATSSELSLLQMDRAASEADPGAREVFFHLPWWDEIGAERGGFGFSGLTIGLAKNLSVVARAVLEGIGYAMIARAGIHSQGESEIRLAGGGAQSPIWCRVLADVLGAALIAPRDPSGAIGATCIARLAAGWGLPATLTISSHYAAHQQTIRTVRRAVRWYRKKGLLT